MVDERTLAAFQQVGRDVTALGLAAPGTGNASIWTPEALLITREGARLDRLTDADISVVGRSTAPPAANPAQDILIHRAIYISAGGSTVLHVHPPHAVALSFSGSEYVPDDMRSRHRLDRVPVVSAIRNIVDAVARAIGDSPVVLVSGDGSYVRGGDLDECLVLTAALEAAARISWLRRTLPSHNGVPLTPPTV